MAAEPLILAIDAGSSSVKAAVLRGTHIVGRVASAAYTTDFRDGRAEVPVARVEHALAAAVARLDVAGVRAVGLTGMAPAWLAMDGRGEALTPLVTHQDRRSLDEARDIEAAFGVDGHLRRAGNRPTPGGISSTTCLWFRRNTDVLDRAAVVGHLPTYLLRRMTGRFCVDPSNAAFMGLLHVEADAWRWCDDLCRVAGVSVSQLPEIVDAGEVAGVTGDDAYGLPPGLPVFGGFVDGSGPILAAGARPATLIHSAGTSDVLAACVDSPLPTRGLLCRPLGVGRHWVLAATQAAGSSSIGWVRGLLYPDLDDDAFADALDAAADREPSATFRACLAGDRQSVDQPAATFDGLTLSTTRDDLLCAVVRGLRADHVARLALLLKTAGGVDLAVIATGGGGKLNGLLRRAWPPRGDGEAWAFEEVEQATLRGLGAIVPAGL